MIEIKSFDFLTDDERMIRTKVFIEEQGFKLEFDEIDSKAVHLVLYYDGCPAACVRYFKGENEGEYVLGRLAVLKPYRGRHLGELLVQETEKRIRKLGASRLSLSAQVRASGFYKKLGFKQSGEIYFDEYCEHIHMEKILD